MKIDDLEEGVYDWKIVHLVQEVWSGTSYNYTSREWMYNMNPLQWPIDCCMDSPLW